MVMRKYLCYQHGYKLRLSYIECISITSLANVHSNANMNVYSKNSPSTLSSERAIARIKKSFPMSDHVITHYKKEEALKY